MQRARAFPTLDGLPNCYPLWLCQVRAPPEPGEATEETFCKDMFAEQKSNISEGVGNAKSRIKSSLADHAIIHLKDGLAS